MLNNIGKRGFQSLLFIYRDFQEIMIIYIKIFLPLEINNVGGIGRPFKLSWIAFFTNVIESILVESEGKKSNTMNLSNILSLVKNYVVVVMYFNKNC